MRFLRMLTNSLLAGAFGSAYLTILVLQLNPEVPLLSSTTWAWFATFVMIYGVHFAVLFYVALVAREFLTMNVMSPGWISVRLLAWLGALLAGGAAILMWLNVRGLATALSEIAEWRMTAGAVATTASAAILFAIAVAHYSFGRRGSRVGASLFMIAIVASMALPIAARGRGLPGETPAVHWSVPAPPVADVSERPRVSLVLLDGATLEHIYPRAAEGRLPNFDRIRSGGAVMNLATTRPTQPNPVWSAVATGMYPASNGVRATARYYARNDPRGIGLLPDHSLSHVLVQLGFVRDEPVTAEGWGSRPLWSILSDAGVSAGVVRWPLTHPAPPINGFVLSDRFHQVTESVGEFPQAMFPQEIARTVQAGLPDPGGELPTGFAEGSPEAGALQRDRLYSRIARALRSVHDPRLFAIRYEGLDTIGHYYYDQAQLPPPRGASEEDWRRYAQVVDRYYAYIDGELGALMEALTPGDLVVVVSGFGMTAVGPTKRFLARVIRDPAFSGTHERAPDGFMIAYGSAVQPGSLPRGSIVDVTPTLLYFFGLPVARDMDGYARSDLFTREFTAERPVTFIPSYR
jgi:hypothetical protein